MRQGATGFSMVRIGVMPTKIGIHDFRCGLRQSRGWRAFAHHDTVALPLGPIRPSHDTGMNVMTWETTTNRTRKALGFYRSMAAETSIAV